MIVPSKNQKTYGVIHTENYFSFLGFCKKVNSDKIQKVDIFVNDTLIDTIVADKHIEKIEDIYELEGFGFIYNLPDKYIGQKNLISFKNHETKEDLQNSPYELIDETHPKFNEARFLNSLEKPIDEEKVKDMYCPNSIGFLATDNNLNDEDFINYIKELYNKFTHITFKAFYFNENQKKLIERIFDTNLKLSKIISINDILNSMEIYLCNGSYTKDYLVFQKVKSFIYPIYINIEYLSKPFSEKTTEEINELVDNLGLENNFEYNSTGNQTYTLFIENFLNASNEIQQKIIQAV